MTIQDIKRQSEEKRTVLFNNCGLFWAFSNEQFSANKTPLKEGEKYISIGNGGYLSKGNVDLFLSGMETIRKEENKQIKALKLQDQEILAALSNYECFYTGDVSDAYDELKDKYSRERILKVFYKNKKQYQESI